MPRKYVSNAARCPFYHMEDTKSVVCEGVAPSWTITMSKDGKTGNAKGYKLMYCYDRWEECLLARALQEKYK